MAMSARPRVQPVRHLRHPGRLVLSTAIIFSCRASRLELCILPNPRFLDRRDVPNLGKVLPINDSWLARQALTLQLLTYPPTLSLFCSAPTRYWGFSPLCC
jgi:hypothetical protein